MRLPIKDCQLLTQYEYDARVALGDELLSEAAASFKEAVTVTALYSLLDEATLKLALSVDFTLKFDCHRCLSPSVRAFSAKLEETFSNDGLLPWDDNGVEIDALVKEVILNSIPTRLLCKDSCKTPKGVLSEDEKTAAELEDESPFSVLRGLIKD